MAQEIIPGFERRDPDELSPLELAFIGDGVYELIIRNRVLLGKHSGIKDANEKTTALARASTQSRMILSVEDELSEEELRIFKRGRNAKSLSTPKSCTVSEYRHATGFEALIGYLFLAGKTDRAVEIIEQGIRNISE